MAEIFIGNQTARHLTDPWLPFHYGLVSGFAAFEWFADFAPDGDGKIRGWNFDQCLPPQRAVLKNLAAQKKMRFSAHARWDADPRLPDGAAAIREALQFAEQIGAAVAVVHLCDKIDAIPAFAAALCPLAQNFPTLKIAVENTPLSSPAHFQSFFAELKKFPNAAQIGMTFDFGHANCCDATRNDYVRFLNELPTDARIFHLHVHENWGDRDAHLPLFTGPAANDDRGIKAAVKAIAKFDFSGSAILEQYPEPPDLLRAAARRLGEIFAARHYTVIAGKNDENTFADFCAGIIPEIPAPVSRNVSAPENSPAAPTAPTVSAQDADTVELAAEISEPAPKFIPTISPAAVILPPAESPEPALKFTRVLLAVNRETLDNYVATITDALRLHTSWRTRLQWIRDEINGGQMTAEKLAALAVLLRYLATGALICAEDGGHYRPNHHAQAGAEIEAALEKIAAPAWLRRRIYPYLPSHAAAFAVKEPLTRIRDIAHRNDIPKDLKLRIKHDLQNKLHRSAGPEDLITAKAILADITVSGANYSPDFVREFKTFFAELSDFFNVPDLADRLRAVAEKFPRFATACAEFFDDRRPPLAQIAAAVTLRGQFAAELNSAAIVDRQTLRMADLDLENLTFARLSELLNRPPTTGSTEWFNAAHWAILNAAISETDTPELRIIAEELDAWRADFQLENPLHAARMLATFSRLLRACADYQAKLYVLLLPAAEKIGAALKVSPSAIAAFGEGIIRAGVLFQPAKMAETLLPVLRGSLRLPAWDIIVPGVATGKLFTADSLAEIPPQNRDLIARLNHADGDEEIPHYIRGVILATPLPQLSHLAIRARQQGVVFATAEDPAIFEKLAAFANREITFAANADGVKIDDGAIVTRTPLSSRAPSEFVAPAKIARAEKITLLTAAQITRENSGAKAANGARLAELTKNKTLDAAAPTAFAIPFGVMETLLRGSHGADAYECLTRSLPFSSEPEILDKLPALREIILNLPDLPPEFFAPLVAQFPTGTRFAARSSSNGEDLKNLAGAGLYDSVVGVAAENLADAVKQVWASLWTRRAALSRHYQAIPHAEVAMAVLLQEALAPDYSFVIHTADPASGERGKAKIEIAVGLGETLASANQPGRPYQLTVTAEKARLWSCADYAYALRIAEPAGRAKNELSRELVNYAKVSLSANERELLALADRLGDVARAIEREFDGPQDIEGALADNRIYLVQTRPQTGLF